MKVYEFNEFRFELDPTWIGKLSIGFDDFLIEITQR